MTHEALLEQLAAVLGEAEPGAGASTLARLDDSARAHLAECAECNLVARGLADLADGGAVLFGDEPPARYGEDFARRLAARLQAEGRGTRTRGWSVPGRPWLLAAAAVLAAVLGLALRGGRLPGDGASLQTAARSTAPAAVPTSASPETDTEVLAAASLDAAFGDATFLDSLDDDADADRLAATPDWDALDETNTPILSGEALHLLGDTLEASLDTEAAAELARRIREDMTS